MRLPPAAVKMEPRGSRTQDTILSRVALNDNKAGMQGLDKDKINNIILETSKVCCASYGFIQLVVCCTANAQTNSY